eukprot:15373028-Alexandrium_andersonii.AAC.1
MSRNEQPASARSSKPARQLNRPTVPNPHPSRCGRIWSSRCRKPDDDRLMERMQQRCRSVPARPTTPRCLPIRMRRAPRLAGPAEADRPDRTDVRNQA